MEKGAIYPLFYLPPVHYFSNLIQDSTDIYIERFEHFPKQTYRNRASIYSPNGKLDLIVPVKKGSKVHTPVKDVRISYDFDWQRLHWLSLQTSYRSSAFFEFYEDDFARFYTEKPEFLFDYNHELLTLLLKLLKLDVKFELTDSYEKLYPEVVKDLRDSMSAKQQSPPETKPYFQVFEDRNGFISNLSIVDLLFNQGPQSNRFL